jgi:hypothetical protein
VALGGLNTVRLGPDANQGGMPLKKRLFVIIGVLILAAGIFFTGFRVIAQKLAHRGDRSPLPVYAAKEPESDLYVRPEPASIEGYDGSAMEPFISPDGQYLFFNNENDPRVNTNLHFAERTGKHAFRRREP